MTARRSDSAARGPVRSSSQAAPGPCTVARRAPRHSANCSAVMSEKPTTTFGSARTASRSSAVDDALDPVAAAGAQHAADLGVAQGKVEVGQPVRIGAGEVARTRVHVGAVITRRPQPVSSSTPRATRSARVGPDGDTEHDLVARTEHGRSHGRKDRPDVS